MLLYTEVTFYRGADIFLIDICELPSDGWRLHEVDKNNGWNRMKVSFVRLEPRPSVRQLSASGDLHPAQGDITDG